MLVVVGTSRWAQVSGVAFWRFAFTYGQEQTDTRVGHPFEAGLRLWRDVFRDPGAESARLTVRRGAISGTGGLALRWSDGLWRRSHSPADMDTLTAARRWADVWGRAWPAADVDAIDALYADGAVFYSSPFRDRQAPRDYVTWAFSEQAEAECRFGEPVVSGDRAAVDWWAVMTGTDGAVESIAGTSLLRFDAEGLVVEQRDVWAIEPGLHELADWAR